MPNAGWSGKGAQFHSVWLTGGFNIGAMMTFVELRNRAQLALFSEDGEDRL
jgi:hypothetical protein